MNPKELADQIDDAANTLQILVGRADDVLQDDEMPEPYDQWQDAVDAAQDAWIDLQDSSDFGGRILTITDALRKAHSMEAGE